MSNDGQVRTRSRQGKDPWRKTPTSELADQVLPRWFVLTALALIPVALAAVVVVFVAFGSDPLPPAERRPPPAGGLTTGVGDFTVGPSVPVPVEGLCPSLDGTQVAGTEADRAVLATGLQALCDIRLDAELALRLRAFAQAGGVVRFAQFEVTGVDSTAQLDASPPRILVNAKFARTDPTWIAPLVAHDVTFLQRDPATAEAALAAREVEAMVCERLFTGHAGSPPAPSRRPSRGCNDAAAVLALPDPLTALRDAGFR